MNRGQFTSTGTPVQLVNLLTRYLLLIKSFSLKCRGVARKKVSSSCTIVYSRTEPTTYATSTTHACICGYWLLSAIWSNNTERHPHSIPPPSNHRFHHYTDVERAAKTRKLHRKKATGILTVQLSRQLLPSPPPRADASGRRAQRTYVAVASRPFAASARPRGAAPRSIRRRVV